MRLRDPQAIGEAKDTNTPHPDPEWDKGNHTLPEVHRHHKEEEQVEKPPVKNRKEAYIFTHIMDSRISESLEKPLKLNSYTEKGDPDEHVRHVDDRLNFYHIDDVDSSIILCENITTLFISGRGKQRQ